MKIVLLKDVDGVGRRGQIVNVAPGFARNFLLPRRQALRASAGAQKLAEEMGRAQHRHEAKEREAAQQRADRLSGISLTIIENAGEGGKLFGSVTAADVSTELMKHDLGFEIDKRDVLLEEPIKVVGRYTVPVKLFQDVQADVELWVVPRSAEDSDDGGTDA